ncbi:MAG: hypothetical protein PUG60_07190 [Lachnospiraceae bacterium]|nr:hypothetical protein [Lachnospiraceae bacterium]
MAIYLQCREEILRDLLVRTEMVLYEGKGSLDGYASGLSENVRRQAEAVYTVVGSMITGDDEQDGEMIIGEWFPYDAAAVVNMKKIPGRLQAPAAYCLAVFHEAGLHGLLIPAKGDLLVGVWLYRDYDYDQPIIRSQELLEDAYDKGGMLLAFSCTAMLMKKTFSEAVNDGCRILKDYTCAVDMNLENRDVPGSIYRIFEKEECREEIISGTGMKSVETDSSKEEENWILQAFRDGYQEEKVKTAPAAADMACCPFSGAFSPVLSAVIASPLGLVSTSEKQKNEILTGLMETYLANRKKLLVVSGRELNDRAFEQLRKDGFDRFIWHGEADETIDTYAVSLNGSASREISRKMSLLQKRYEENSNKLNRYLEILESGTVEDMTLISLLEKASDTEDSRFHAVFSNTEKKTVFGTDLRRLFGPYVQAWRDCCYMLPDGSVGFDLTSYSQDEIAQLKEMLCASEVVITRFLEKLNEYGYAVKKIYQPDGGESRKEYFKTVMAINDFMIACVDLQNAADADELPEATPEEEQEVKDYQEYLCYREIHEAAGNMVDFSQAASMDGEAVEKLQEITERLTKSGLDTVSIPIPRQMVKDSQELEELLRSHNIYTSQESLKCRAGAGKNTVLKALCGAFARPELIKKYAGGSPFEEVFAFWKDCASGEGYLFWLQKELVKYYTAFRACSGIEKETKALIDGMMDCMTDPEKKMTDSQQQLLDQAVELFTDYYTPFHEMEKEIFGFLNLSYKEFDRIFPERMLMEFILEWKEMLETDRQYENYIHESAALERHDLNRIMEQIKTYGMTPEEAEEEFNRFWIRGAAVYWSEQLGFDYVDYEMTSESLKNSENQLLSVKNTELFNRLLEERKKIIQEHPELISEKEAAAELFNRDADLFLSLYPVIMIKPQAAADINAAEICAAEIGAVSGSVFDRLILADGEAVPFSQVTGLIGKTERLTILSPKEMLREEADDRESAAHKALRMGIPVIREERQHP